LLANRTTPARLYLATTCGNVLQESPAVASEDVLQPIQFLLQY